MHTGPSSNIKLNRVCIVSALESSIELDLDEVQLPAADLTCMLQPPQGVQLLEKSPIEANYILSAANDLQWSALIPATGRSIADGDKEGGDVVLWFVLTMINEEQCWEFHRL